MIRYCEQAIFNQLIHLCFYLIKMVYIYFWLMRILTFFKQLSQ